MQIKVYYPSGNTFTLCGQWKGPGRIGSFNAILIIADETVKIGNQVVTKGGCLIGDPRGVYQDLETGQVLYNPRDHIVGMEKVWVEWLGQHPEWPAVLEVT